MKKIFTQSSWLLSIIILCTTSCQKHDEDISPVSSYGASAQFLSQDEDLILESDTDMRVLTINDYKDSVILRSSSINVKPDSADIILMHLIDRMYQTVIKAGGVGIASPQVGIKKNIIWVKRMDKLGMPFECYINPRIITYGSPQISFYGDGCLSTPSETGTTKRSPSVFVSYNLLDGSYHEENIEGYGSSNFTAVIFQHEIDHLNGVLWIDRKVN